MSTRHDSYEEQLINVPLKLFFCFSDGVCFSGWRSSVERGGCAWCAGMRGRMGLGDWGRWDNGLGESRRWGVRANMRIKMRKLFKDIAVLPLLRWSEYPPPYTRLLVAERSTSQMERCILNS